MYIENLHSMYPAEVVFSVTTRTCAFSSICILSVLQCLYILCNVYFVYLAESVSISIECVLSVSSRIYILCIQQILHPDYLSESVCPVEYFTMQPAESVSCVSSRLYTCLSSRMCLLCIQQNSSSVYPAESVFCML